jgi:hypothetical protein
MDVRIEIIGGMAGETVAWNRRPLPFSVALMALGAVGERVHAGEWEAGPAMNLERLHIVPSPGGVATAASAAQPGLMRVAVAVSAVARHSSLAAVALVAGRGIVSPAERKPGAGVVEAFSRLCSGHLPARRSMAVPAIHSLGERVVTASFGTSGLPFGIFGHGDPRNPGEDGNAEHDDDRAAHRLPFLRACGLP